MFVRCMSIRSCAADCIAMAWESKDVCLAQYLEDSDISKLRAASRDWKEAIDATLTRLRPVSLRCPHLSSRLLPGLKSLLLDHTKLTLLPHQLKECSVLTQLTQLHLGGPACFTLRTQHLEWIGSLTRLQDLKIRGCTKVCLSVVSHWHPLQQVHTLALVGLAFTAADTPALSAFLAAGSAVTLTSLILGDQQGLSFLSDAALQGLGDSISPGGRLQNLDLSGCIELTDAGIQQLKGVGPSLKTLTLHNCMKIGPGTAALISSTFNHLTSLNLRGCCQLSDDSLTAALSGPVCLHLAQLSLQSCSALTGGCIPAAASNLVALTELNLAYCSALQPLHLTALRQLPVLQVLSLAGCAAVSSAEVMGSVLGGLTGLKQLDGSGWTVRGEYAQQLPPAAAAEAAAGPGPEEVEEEEAQHILVGCSTSSSNSAATRHTEPGANTSTESSSSSSSSSSTTDAPLLLLPPNLQSLKLTELNCRESIFQGLLHNMPKTLTSLDLSNIRVAGVGVQGPSLKPLQGLVNLEVLNLSGTTGGCLLAQDMSFLGGMTSLGKLQVDHIHAGAAAAVPAVAAVAQQARGTISTAAEAAAEAEAAAVGAAGVVNAAQTTVAMPAGPVGSGSSSSSSDSSQIVLLDSPALPVVVAANGLNDQVQQQRQQQHQQQQQQRQTAGIAALLIGIGSSQVSSSNLDSSSTADDLATTAVDLSQLHIHSRQSSLSSSSNSTVAVRRNLFAPPASTPPSSSGITTSQQESLTHLAVVGQSTEPQQQQQQQQQQVWLHMSPSVQDLSVSFSPGLCDAELASLGDLTALKSLDLLACHSFTGTGFSSWGSVSALTSLTLTGCSGLTDSGLAALAAAVGPQLQDLSLPGCRGLTDGGVGALEVATNLRTLKLSSNRGLNGRFLSRLFPSLGRLRNLSLALCSGLEDEGLLALAAAPRLDSLDLHCCWRLSDTGMLSLLSNSKSLMQVNIDGCPRLSVSACPTQFVAVDALVGGSRLDESSSPHKRPGLLIRVPQ